MERIHSKIKNKHLLLFILIVCIVVVSFFWQKKTDSRPKPITVINPSTNTDSISFPRQNPQFEAVIKKDNYVITDQESIIIYHDGKKVFSAKQYADGFKGRTLTYQFYDDRPAFVQDGDLGMIGCGQGCAFSFSNYYIWDDKNKQFKVDNAAWSGEKNSFLFDDGQYQKYQDQYNSLDKSGCVTDLTEKYKGLSYTQIYQKYPYDKEYCDPKLDSGVNHDKLIYFLKAKKAVEEVLQGKNINSDEIPRISI